MHASLILAEAGVHVYLVDSSATVGGLWNLLDKTFPTHSCGICHMSTKNPAYCPVIEVARHPRVTLMVNSLVEEVLGDIGDFRVRVSTRPEFVKSALCDGCGECERACPVEVRLPRHLGLDDRKAIVRPGGRAVLGGYAVDEEACTRCGECARACPRGAINLAAEGTETTLAVGAIIVCSGAAMCDPSVRPEYMYGLSKNVMTGLEFERVSAAALLSNEGLLRPGDGARPDRIAFIQCVGSRDRSRASPYCSSVCCMYAVKEAIIAKTLVPEASVKVFYTDVRALGKGYEEYYVRAKALGVEFENCRVSSVEDNEGALEVRAESGGVVRRDSFDLVVLSNGFVPAGSLISIGAVLGLERDEFGFVRPLSQGRSRVTTSRPGVYVCGGAAGPQDIPTSVLWSGACALQALRAVGPEADWDEWPALRLDAGEQTDRPGGGRAADLGSEATVQNQVSTATQVAPASAAGETRVGVFVCECEASLGSVDPARLVHVLSGEPMPDVVVVKGIPPVCKREGVEALAREAASHRVNRVVVAACSPRRVQDLIGGRLSQAGVEHGMVEVANIREQCGWVHDHPGKAERKARDLVAMAVASVRMATVLVERARPVPAGAVVIGGGPAGMHAAACLADLGHHVHLVEKDEILGGRARALARTLDGTDVRELLEKLEERVRSDNRITVHTSSRVASVHRRDGGFSVSIVRNRDSGGAEPERLADDLRCTGEGSGFRGGRGGCAEEGGAAIACGAVVVATGGREAPGPASLPPPDGARVLTQTELEARLWPSLDIPGAIRSVVMIQCAGSRDETRPYCSQVCCSQAIKNAIRLKEERPDVEVYVLHRDVRVPGAWEAFYERAREMGVVFVRHHDDAPPRVVNDGDEPGGSALAVEVLDDILGETIIIPADLVVLSTGAVGAADRDLAMALGVPVDGHGFLTEANVKVQPVDTCVPGVYVCGLARAPGFLSDALVSAEAAAARAGVCLASREERTVGNVSRVRARRCSGCGVCVAVCAHGARSLDEETRRAVVDEFLCRGCGACQAACPSGAASHAGFETERVMSALDAALGG
jgi:heterodisulfide reductase subunit A